MGGLENFMHVYGVHTWLVLALVLGAAEVFTITFFILPFALGAVVAAIVAGFDMPLNGQLIVFACSSLAMLFVIQYVARKYLSDKKFNKIRTNYSAMVGREALVLEPIDGEVRTGSVKLGGETWSAISQEGLRFEKDDIVRVLAVGGAKLTVVERERQIEHD